MSEYLTITEASGLITASKPLLQARCKDGTIPSIRVGTSYRILRSDLEAWVKHTPSQFKGNRQVPSEELTQLLAEWADLMTNVNGNSIDTVSRFASLKWPHLGLP